MFVELFGQLDTGINMLKNAYVMGKVQEGIAAEKEAKAEAEKAKIKEVQAKAQHDREMLAGMHTKLPDPFNRLGMPFMNEERTIPQPTFQPPVPVSTPSSWNYDDIGGGYWKEI